MTFDQLKQKNIALATRLLARDPHRFDCDDMRAFPPGPFSEEDVAEVGFVLAAAGHNPAKLGFRADGTSPDRQVFADLVMSTAAIAADSLTVHLPMSADSVRMFSPRAALALATAIAIAGGSSEPWMVELFALAASWTTRSGMVPPRPGSAAAWAKAALVETIASVLTRSAVACCGADELAEWDESTPDIRASLVATFAAARKNLTGDDAQLLGLLVDQLTTDLSHGSKK